MVVMTSSPGPMPSASSARCSPAVAELTAIAVQAGVAEEGGEVGLEALRLRPGGDPAGLQRVDHLGDFLVADVGQGKGQEGHCGRSSLREAVSSGRPGASSSAPRHGGSTATPRSNVTRRPPWCSTAKRQQVDIGDLARTEHAVPAQPAPPPAGSGCRARTHGCASADRRGPGARATLRGRLRVRIRGQRQDAQAAVLRQRARRPALPGMRRQPVRRTPMMQVRRRRAAPPAR